MACRTVSFCPRRLCCSMFRKLLSPRSPSDGAEGLAAENWVRYGWGAVFKCRRVSGFCHNFIFDCLCSEMTHLYAGQTRKRIKYVFSAFTWLDVKLCSNRSIDKLISLLDSCVICAIVDLSLKFPTIGNQKLTLLYDESLCPLKSSVSLIVALLNSISIQAAYDF